MKTKDIFLNIAVNPNMTLEDLVSVGLTSENTMLLDRAQYASNEKVQAMFKDNEGNFDEQKFNIYYDLAEQSYNILANDDVNLDLTNITAYDVDNIFVDPNKRRKKNEPYILKLPNPDRLNVGVTRIGKIDQRTLSRDEIAQSQKVLLNPVAVANGEDPIYGDSPNESWFEDFWDTKVLAAWDEDGVHIDPVTGEEKSHKKGDLKLNENGTYYYESLDGRSVYGKQILNKFNTLTTDGSSWNKYDFFDSDDIKQKSIGGSILKNLALVGSMFIPYVGWGVAAASVIHQSAGLFATLGKMLAGSDSETLNAIEGWVKSTDRRNLKTEYAQQKTWCWENFINLIGDTTAQLREQRAIFKFAPGIIKGDFKALNEKAMKEYGEKIMKESVENVTNKNFKELVELAQKQNPNNWKEQWKYLLGETKGVFSAKAEKQIRDYIQSYYKLGEPIAKAYMTAITVQDTFGEAIEAGATDTEAALLTIGYAAAEAALLSTNLGKWIMPELRTEKLRHKMIAKKLLELPTETREMSKSLSRLPEETKKAWVKRLFDIGKDIANAEYSMLPKTMGTILAQGLGEGIEEVSEEALADFSKSCFNLTQQLQGDDVRLNAWNYNWNWKEAVDRYGMSFVGGIFGGGINAAASDYKANREILNMNSQQALQQLVYMTRNNEIDDFWKVINKTTLASKELSTKINEDGTGYKPGTKDDNQDLAAKQALRKQIDLINSIINAENANLNDSGLLATLINADPSLKNLDPVKEYRMRALSNSVTAGRFLNEWNTITSDIVKNQIEQQKISSKYSNENSEKISESDEKDLKELKKQLKILQERKDNMLDGTRTREYVRDALFEMSHGVNETFNDLVTEVRYAEAKSGKKYSNLSEDQKKEYHDKYEAIKNSNQYAEKIHELADVYEALAISASDKIKESYEFYKKIQENEFKNIQELNYVIENRLYNLTNLLNNPDKGIISIQEILNDEYKKELILFDDSTNLIQNLKQLEQEIIQSENAIRNGKSDELLSDFEKNEINSLYNKFVYESKLNIFDSVYDKIINTCDEFLQAGFIHPETKESLTKMINSLQKYIISELIDETGEETPYKLKDDILLEKLNEIQELSNTPIIDNLSKFILSTTSDQTVLDLLKYLQNEETLNYKDIKSFSLNNTTLENFKDAKDLLTLYRSVIVGARYDNIDLENIVGFNTTLNELSGKEENLKLAEIDGQTADLILEDINKLLSKLDYFERLHKLNNGDKYNIQDKTALNKNYIMFNKYKHFISILDKDNDWNQSKSFSELKNLILNDSPTLLENSGTDGNYANRKFSLTLEQKNEIEKESLAIQQKLHEFFQENLNLSDDIAIENSIKKLSKILTYDNFKGLIRENNDYLHQNSEDIDDYAFIWWLCSTAALSIDQFYNNYRYILGDETPGEKPIAPIPTQELGVFALTASIVNGDMFKIFAKAIHNSLSDLWENSSEEKRRQIQKEAESYYILDESKKKYFKNNDFLPNFENILFVEGISGSGKTTGVLKTLSKLLAKTNPDFINQKVFFAHVNKTKAEKLGKSTTFTDFEAFDHDSLLYYMSADYKPIPMTDGVYEYHLDKDIFLEDGLFRANWKIRSYQDSQVPKLIIIDEWSHYNQVEQDLIQRFAQTYGITVLVMGDYDQLTPESKIITPDGEMGIVPNRNTSPRVVKLGISMRTDNDLKTGNIYRMLAWAKSPTKTPVNLHYYEDETGIYGDKLYTVDNTYGSQLQNIQNDVKKMIATLKENKEEANKIGYIYHDVESELYKWLTTTEGIKEYINPLLEKDAHGDEAQYYIVENNREVNQDALSYFKSVYTGVTRSEQGSILIARSDYITRTKNKNGESLLNLNKYNSNGVKFKSIKAKEMNPDTYKEEGTKNFIKKRKNTLDYIYQNQKLTPFNIKYRSKNPIITNIQNLNQPQPEPQPQPQSQPDNSINELPPIPDDLPQEIYDQMNISPKNEIPPARTEEEIKEELQETWQGPYQKNQILYDRHAKSYKIIGENLSDLNNPKYVLEDLENGNIFEESKEDFNSWVIESLPEESPIFNIDDKFLWNNKIYTVLGMIIDTEDGLNKNSWEYHVSSPSGLDIIDHYYLKQLLHENKIRIYTESSNELKAKPTDFEAGSGQDYKDIIEEEFAQNYPNAVTQSANSADIDFNLLGYTFQTQYFADDFDSNDNIIPVGGNRIDCGYGLYKINNAKFKTKNDIEQAISSIRKHLQYKSNNEIVDHIYNLTGLPNLTIRWGFVSKTDDFGKTRYNRFNAPKAKIEYVQNETQVHKKSLSAIIFDQYGNAILEIPMVMFQSPHSIFHQMSKLGIGYDILNIWQKKQSKDDTSNILKEILAYIRTQKQNLPGYQSLGDVIELWLFSNNGVKLLDKSWNLHKDGDNLGSLFIKERFAEDVPEFDFVGTWKDLPKLKRKDRFMSSIFMNNDDTYESPNGMIYQVFKAYTPYVIISDSPDINSDTDAINQYLYQISNPNSEKIVTLIPLKGPEVTVSEYMRAMHDLLTQDPSNNNIIPFGNPYTPYRIWQTILNSSDKDVIMSKLSPQQRQDVNDIITLLQNAESTIDRNSFRTKLEYQKKVANVLNKINSQHQVFPKLRKLLVSTCFYNAINANNYVNEDILALIQKVCDHKDSKITGVQCKAQFAATKDKGILKFAHKVKVDANDPFKFPGYGYFQAFSKIDPPTYNLNSIKKDIKNWVNDIKKGYSIFNEETGEEIILENVWYFKNKSDEELYLPKEYNTHDYTKNLIDSCNDLIRKLKISDYNINAFQLEEFKSESSAKTRALQMIHDEFKKNPGAFVIQVNNTYKYGNIDIDQNSELKGFLFKGYKFSKGKYTLEFYNNNETKFIELELDPQNDSFIIPIISNNTDFSEIINNLNDLKTSDLIKNNVEIINIVDQILNYINSNNSINIDDIENIIQLSTLNEDDQIIIESMLDLDKIQQIDCVIPKKIKFIL